MTKEVKKLLLVIWMTVVAVCCLPTITVAEEGVAKSDEREEMISDAVLPVAVGYRNDSGEVSYYLNGTSFLINEQAVLTNKHVAVPDEILLEKIMEEHALNELPEKDERLGIYVMTGKNMFVPAKIHASVQSDRMDFAVLQLSSKLYDRERLTLGKECRRKKETLLRLSAVLGRDIGKRFWRKFHRYQSEERLSVLVNRRRYQMERMIKSSNIIFHYMEQGLEARF